MCGAPIGAVCNIVQSIETQRQRSDLVIARTTPALLALFSLVCLIAYQPVTTGNPLPLRLTAWYRKAEATFSDVLAMVRRSLWAEKYFLPSVGAEEPTLLPRKTLKILLDQLASTA